MDHSKIFPIEIDDTDVDKYIFEQLLEVIIVMSLSVDKQKGYYGSGWIGEEMLIDFNHYFSNKEMILSKSYLKEAEFSKIEQLNDFLDQITENQRNDFFTSLGTHPDWELIRQKAKECLKEIGKGNLTITYERETETHRNWYGKKIIVERTKTKLVEKS